MITLLEQENNTQFSTMIATLLLLIFYFQVVVGRFDEQIITLVLICLSFVWITFSLFFT
jgi:hypothetical protein